MLESMCKSFIWSGLLSAISVRAAYGITARNILFVALRCSSAKIAQGGTILSDTHIDVCKGGPLLRGAPRVRGHIGAHRRQVDRTGGRRALAWTDALQPDIQAGRGCLATHADADV